MSLKSVRLLSLTPSLSVSLILSPSLSVYLEKPLHFRAALDSDRRFSGLRFTWNCHYCLRKSYDLFPCNFVVCTHMHTARGSCAQIRTHAGLTAVNWFYLLFKTSQSTSVSAFLFTDLKMPALVYTALHTDCFGTFLEQFLKLSVDFEAFLDLKGKPAPQTPLQKVQL